MTETPRQMRHSNRERLKSLEIPQKPKRIYNLRSSMANPIDDAQFMDENYSDMDSVFGETQEQFIDQLVMPRLSNNHINLGIPTGMVLHRDREHSLTQYLDLELPAADRGFSDHLYKMTPEFETTQFAPLSASDPNLIGGDPESSRSRWFLTYESMRHDFLSCIGRLRLLRDRRKHH